MVVKGGKGDEEGWLSTGGSGNGGKASTGDVRTLEGDVMGEREVGVYDEDEVPDMEDEEDDQEAIIRDTKADPNA